MIVSYEKLTPAHLPQMYDIRFSVKENLPHPHQIQYLQREQAERDINQGGGWICKTDNQYIGYGFGIWIPDPLVGGLFVRPEFSGSGVGTQLLERVSQWLFSGGAKKIMLTTDPGSLAETFYKKREWLSEGRDEFGQLIFVKQQD